MRTFFFVLLAGSLPLGAYATGGFSKGPSGPMTRITAPIEATTYDGSIFLTDAGRRLEIAIGAPPFTLKRGLPFSDLAIGKTVTVDAFDSSSDASDKLYARRIVIDGRIVDLRV